MRTHSRDISLVILLNLLCLWTPAAYAWGSRGHQTINAAAAQVMTSPGAAFFRANQDALAALATVPDDPWKGQHYAEEGGLHFCDWDLYLKRLGAAKTSALNLGQARERFGSGFVQKNGAAPWRIEQIYGRLVEALRQGDWQRSLQLAGVMGHYLGDLSQPMHNSSDYDGQSLGKPGIHFYFETTLVGTVERSELISNAVGEARGLKGTLEGQRTTAANVRLLAFREVGESFAALPGLLAEFAADTPDDERLKSHFGPWMGRGAAYLAEAWDRAILASGRTAFPAVSLGELATPEWFAIDDDEALLKVR